MWLGRLMIYGMWGLALVGLYGKDNLKNGLESGKLGWTDSVPSSLPEMVVVVNTGLN